MLIISPLTIDDFITFPQIDGDVFALEQHVGGAPEALSASRASLSRLRGSIDDSSGVTAVAGGAEARGICSRCWHAKVVWIPKPFSVMRGAEV